MPNSLWHKARSLADPLASSLNRLLTKAEVGKLGLTDLQGTSLMRAHPHGYLVETCLWHKACSFSSLDTLGFRP